MCAARSLPSFGLRGFFEVLGLRGVWRFPVFFIAVGAPDSDVG
jgi:hypothetical protein